MSSQEWRHPFTLHIMWVFGILSHSKIFSQLCKTLRNLLNHFDLSDLSLVLGVGELIEPAVWKTSSSGVSFYFCDPKTWLQIFLTIFDDIYAKNFFFNFLSKILSYTSSWCNQPTNTQQPTKLYVLWDFRYVTNERLFKVLYSYMCTYDD